MYYFFVLFFLQIQQPETAELWFKLSLRLCNIPQGKSVQNELFMEITILKLSVYQIHGHLMACYKACINIQAFQLFGAKSIAKIICCNTAFISSTFTKVWLTCMKR